MIDPIKSLLASAAEEQSEFEIWFGMRMGEFVGEMEDAGAELEDIPKALTGYAAWLRANLDLFRE